MNLGAAVVDYPQQAAVNTLEFIASRYPQALPGIVAELEAAAGRRTGLGEEDPPAEDTRSWWRRGLDAITDLGTTAIEVIGKRKLADYMTEGEAEDAKAQYDLQLAAARRQAELAEAQAQELAAQAEYRRQIAAIEAAEQSERIQAYLPWVFGAVGAFVLWNVIRK